MAATDVPSNFDPSNLLPHASLLSSLIDPLCSTNLAQAEDALTTFTKTLDYYLLLPTLLDPVIKSLLDPLLSHIRNLLPSLPQSSTFSSRRPIHIPFIALYSLAKVRGPKPFSRLLPHTITDVHFLLSSLPLFENHPNAKSLWHIRYFLYLWFSVAIRIPFPLNSIINNSELSTIIQHAQNALHQIGPVATASAQFLARLLSRRDVINVREQIVHWALNVHTDARVAALAFLAALFKHAQRQDLQPFLEPILDTLELIRGTEECGTKESHLVVKLATRVALAALPPKVAAWRYQRGNRVAFETHLGEVRRVAKGVTGHIGNEESVIVEDMEEREVQVVERVVEIIAQGLRHQDTVVRWSAAKGVGRVTGRLPRDYAEEVVEEVFSLFEYETGVRKDAVFHGGCLALAELARRGLLLPGDLEFGRAFEVIAKAAKFDMRRGANSVGAHVRDAACYAVWAIARAYSKEDVASYGVRIMESMLPVALLDREVNCRRAAAAAIQECVGRLGETVFEDGIRLQQSADYFALGDRTAAYLRILKEVGELAGGRYWGCLIEELVDRKLMHWDAGVRMLAARALGNVCAVEGGWKEVGDPVLKELLRRSSLRGDMVVRHGALLGLGEIAKTIGGKGLGKYGSEVRDIPKVMKATKLFAGKSSDEMRLACCHLIECLSKGFPEIYNQSTEEKEEAIFALEFLESIFGSGKEDMYSQATSAYSAICHHVISKDTEWHEQVTRRILDGLTKPGSPILKRGFALAAGVCGDSETSACLLGVVCRQIVHNEDVEVRRNAAVSLPRVPIRLLSECFLQIVQTLNSGMADYAVDDRGDIGSWVREASMTSLSHIIRMMFVTPGVFGAEEIKQRDIEEILCVVIEGLVEQSCSRIDRTRAVAGSALVSICSSFSHLSIDSDLISICQGLADSIGLDIPESGDLQASSTVNFGDTDSAFPAVRKWLGIRALSKAVIQGLVSAAGGMGHQSRAAMQALVESFHGINVEVKRERMGFVQALIQSGNERLFTPTLSALQGLANCSALDDIPHEDLIQLVRCVRRGWKGKQRLVKRTIASVLLLHDLGALSLNKWSFNFSEGTLGKECLEALMVILGGTIPRLRRIASEYAYLLLIEFAEDEGIENREQKRGSITGEAVKMLLDTNWEDIDVLDARGKRNLICKFLRISAPTLLRKQKTKLDQ